MTRHVGRLAGIVLVVMFLLLTSACGTETPNPKVSDIEAARTYLAETKASDSEVDGETWDRGIVLKVKLPGAFWHRWEMTVLLADGASTTVRAAMDHEDDLAKIVHPGDYIAFDGGIDDAVLPEEVKILKAGAVTIQGN